MFYSISVKETDSTLANALAILAGIIRVWDFIGLSKDTTPQKQKAPSTLQNIVDASPEIINSWLYFMDTRDAVLRILQNPGQNSSELLKKLSVEQLAALGTSVRILGPGLGAILTASQLASNRTTFDRALYGGNFSILEFFSEQQIAAIPPSSISGLSTNLLNEPDNSQLGTFCRSLGAREIAAMTSEQIASIRYFDWVNPDAFAGLTAEKVSYIRTANTPNGSWRYMTAAQIARMNPEAFSGLNWWQFQTLFEGQNGYTGITAAQLQYVLSEPFARLSAANIAQLTADKNRCAGITGQQIRRLQPVQIGAIANFQWLTESAFGGLQPAQMAYVRIAGQQNGSWAAVSPAAIQYLMPESFAMLRADQIRTLPVLAFSRISSQQIAGMTADAFAGITPEQLQRLSSSAFGAITRAQIIRLSTSHMNLISVPQLRALSGDTVAGLSAQQVGALTAFALIKPEQLQRLASWAFAGITKAQISQLSTSHISVISASQLAGLNPDTVAGLNAQQLAALTTSAFAGFTTDQLGRLTPEAFAGVTAAQIGTLSASRLRALNPDTVASLSAQQLAALTTSAFAGFSTNQLERLAPQAFAGVTAAQIGTLNASQLGALHPDTFAALTDSQFAAVSDTALGGVRAAQLRALSSSKLGKLGLRLKYLSSAALAGLTQVHFDELQQDQTVFARQRAYDILCVRLAQLDEAEVATLFDTWRPDPRLMPAELLSTVAGARLTNWLIRGLDDASRSTWLTRLNDRQLAVLPTDTILALSIVNIDTAAVFLNAGRASAFSVAQFQTLLNSHPDLLQRLDPRVVARMSTDALMSLTPAQIGRLTAAQLRQILTDPTLSKFIFNAGTNGAWSVEQFQALSVSAIAGGGFTQEMLAQIPDLGIFSGEQIFNGLLMNSYLAELVLTGSADGWTEAQRQQWRSIPEMDSYLTQSGLPGGYGRRGRLTPGEPPAFTSAHINHLLRSVAVANNMNARILVLQIEAIVAQPTVGSLLRRTSITPTTFQLMINSNEMGHRALLAFAAEASAVFVDLARATPGLTMDQIHNLTSNDHGISLLVVLDTHAGANYLRNFRNIRDMTPAERQLQTQIADNIFFSDDEDAVDLACILFHEYRVFYGYEFTQQQFDRLVQIADREGMEGFFGPLSERRNYGLMLSFNNYRITQEQLNHLIDAQSVRTGNEEEEEEEEEEGGAHSFLRACYALSVGAAVEA
ncbi:hypothetical protein [Ralstonia chuxiongensis]|uniref:hypothetical protein n=1 Tax=Ralstonia chuxiongensis TaxID=2957504 RepID=UPI0028F66F5A|nr:hypothetical protein [Ralstonia chuxiongensis]CAJ0785105.1 hypothetical protein R8510_05342 [Ralstonia chuxiongensis]